MGRPNPRWRGQMRQAESIRDFSHTAFGMRELLSLAERQHTSYNKVLPAPLPAVAPAYMAQSICGA